jgi:hypothetical protein
MWKNLWGSLGSFENFLRNVVELFNLEVCNNIKNEWIPLKKFIWVQWIIVF